MTYSTDAYISLEMREENPLSKEIDEKTGISPFDELIVREAITKMIAEMTIPELKKVFDFGILNPTNLTEKQKELARKDIDFRNIVSKNFADRTCYYIVKLETKD